MASWGKGNPGLCELGEMLLLLLPPKSRPNPARDPLSQYRGRNSGSGRATAQAHGGLQQLLQPFAVLSAAVADPVTLTWCQRCIPSLQLDRLPQVGSPGWQRPRGCSCLPGHGIQPVSHQQQHLLHQGLVLCGAGRAGTQAGKQPCQL
jgi:hypothetical protein